MAQRTCSAPVQVLTRQATWLCLGFAFTTGWVDVLCTLRFGAFGTMMTGNSIYLAKSAVSGAYTDLLFYSAVIVCYCAGVVVGSRAAMQTRGPTRTAPSKY